MHVSSTPFFYHSKMKNFIYGYPEQGFRLCPVKLITLDADPLCPVKLITLDADPHRDDTELILSTQTLAEGSWTEDDLIRTLLGLDSRDEIQIAL